MEASNAGRVAELFKSALERSPETWASFLDEQCSDNAEVRADVESLLRFKDRGSAFIEEPALHHTAESFLDDDTMAPGQAVDEYTIISRIGRGGMGEVYLARDEKLYRRVALKLVQRGMHTAEIVRRFRHEERILAGLTHSNIARLYGGGVTNDNLPFFVMEYIEGVRIDQYCNDKKLTTANRLQLFRKVCSAIQYAHQHLVVHRDIKPSNILVTGEGEPKLLDFGIAKLLDPETLPADQPTLTIARLLTPDYASPEHVLGETITTSSDVYSLGVLLYELLTGNRPYRITSSKPQEILRIVAEKKPLRPSTALDRSGPQTPVPIDPKTLRGDLDNIILKAMRKEPARRYVSVAQFSGDIERYLGGWPVIARKDTVGYRTSKFIGRNRLAALVAALLFAAIIVGLVTTLWQAQNARTQRDLAQREKLTAQSINSFLQRMLSFSNQSVTSVSPTAQKKNVTINEMLDLITPQVEAELVDQPQVRAQVLRTIGSAYSSQGQYDSAEKTLRAALATQRMLYGDQHRDVAETTFELGVLYFRHLEYEKAAPLLETAVTLYQKQRELHSPDYSAASLVRAMDHLGALRFTYQADYDAGRKLINDALQLALAANFQGQARRVLAAAESDAGAVALYTGETEKGEQLLRQAEEDFQQSSTGARYEEEGTNLTHLGVAAMKRHDFIQAQKYLRDGEQVIRGTLGRSGYLAVNLNRQAILALQQGNLSVAEERAREALAMSQEFSPQHRLSWAPLMSTLAEILTQSGRFSEGEDYLKQAINIEEEEPPKNPVLIAHTKVSLSQCLIAQHRLSDAEKVASEAYEEAKRNLGEQHPASKEAESNLAKIPQKESRADPLR